MQYYERDFEAFLRCTNEKEILKKEILDIFEEYNVKSVLDIGAGNGLLSFPLSKKVDDYLTIEFKKNFCNVLREGGLRVIEGFFPLDLKNQKFDLVLCSHSVPNRKYKFVPFLTSAWEKVNDGGNLLIISYGKKKDDWGLLMRGLNLLSFNNAYENRIEKQEFLSNFGEVDVKSLKSYVTTNNLEEMIEALTFVASAGEGDLRKRFLGKREELIRVLEGKYFDSSKKVYSFPFEHYFLRVRK